MVKKISKKKVKRNKKDNKPVMVENKQVEKKKHNKTFCLIPEHVAFLESVERKSIFIGMLIDGYLKGRFIQPETVEVLRKYKALFGADPEDTIKKVLLKRVDRIENNMNALKDSAPAEVKNKVGGAFLKLNRAYDAVVVENEGLENKLAITFGLMFKKTGCNHQSIRGWIRANKERLDEYHQRIGIDNPSIHNRQVGVIKRVKWQKEAIDKERMENLTEKAEALEKDKQEDLEELAVAVSKQSLGENDPKESEVSAKESAEAEEDMRTTPSGKPASRGSRKVARGKGNRREQNQ